MIRLFTKFFITLQGLQPHSNIQTQHHIQMTGQPTHSTKWRQCGKIQNCKWRISAHSTFRNNSTIQEPVVITVAHGTESRFFCLALMWRFLMTKCFNSPKLLSYSLYIQFCCGITGYAYFHQTWFNQSILPNSCWRKWYTQDCYHYSFQFIQIHQDAIWPEKCSSGFSKFYFKILL